MSLTSQKNTPNSSIESKDIPDSGISKCREKVGGVIFQKISHFQLDEEDTEKIKVRQKDQMLKVNMSYRLVKCCLEDIFGNEADSKMIGIIDTLDIFLSDIGAENIPLTPDEKEMSQCIIADGRITDLTDRVANFLITKAREYNGISEVLDLELLQEVLSNDSADSILEPASTSNEIKSAENAQLSFEGMRTYSRDIEDLDAKCMEKFFQEKIESKEISKNQANRELNKLKLAYGLAKWKFHGTFRDTNERYFNHLRKVAEIILNSAEHPTFDQVIVAILHDIVEDTNISIPTIAKLFGAKIALSVELLTKKSALDFVDETIKSHKKMKERLENSTLINNNGLLCDRVKSILRKIKEKEEQKQEGDDKINLKSKKAYNAEEKLFLERSGLTLQETIDLPKLNFLEEKYKQARNTHYFSKYQDDTELMNQANAVVGKRGFTLSQEQIQEAANNSIIVKLADRHHNLNTLWNKEKISGVIKKVSETIDYLLSAPKGLCDRLQEMVIQDVLKIIGSLQKSSSEFSESEKEDYKNFMIKVQSKSDEIISFQNLSIA